MLVTLLVFWAASSVVLWLLQRMRLNIMRITILSDTFALALAFAGNDLVNFIGVPLASYDAWQIARETGSESIMMGELANPARANFLLLLLSGAVMVLTLFFSKKSRHVTETELSLASQHEGDERFGSTFVSRSLVRASLALNTMWTGLIPDRMQKVIDRRFEPLPAEERSSAPYDMIRAVVNLTAASILIAIGTSYQLPLSTTYVVFMVAMGSSLADRTWGRESAVYRITGVMAVISGLVHHGARRIPDRLRRDTAPAVGRLDRRDGARRTLRMAAGPQPPHQAGGESCRGGTAGNQGRDSGRGALRLHRRGLHDDGARDAHLQPYAGGGIQGEPQGAQGDGTVVGQALRRGEEARDRKYGIMPTLRRLQQCDIDTGHFYVQVVDYLSEVTKALEEERANNGVRSLDNATVSTITSHKAATSTKNRS